MKTTIVPAARRFPNAVFFSLLALALSDLTSTPLLLADDSSPSGASSCFSTKWKPKQSEQLEKSDMTAAGWSERSVDEFIKNAELGSIADAQALVRAVTNKVKSPELADAKDSAFVIHIVGWNSDYTALASSNWYLYEPGEKSSWGYWRGDAGILMRRAIGGKKRVTLLYVYLSSRGPTEPKSGADNGGATQDTDDEKDVAAAPGDYKVSIAAGTSQFLADLKILAGIVNVPGFRGGTEAAASAAAKIRREVSSAAPKPIVAYCALNTFITPNAVSTWKFDATFETSSAQDTVTFNNESPKSFGLAGAMPLVAYSDVVREGTEATGFTTKKVTRQSPYAVVNIFLPKVEPSLRNSCWMPHIMIGLPVSGKALEHPLVGAAVNLRYIELFAAWCPDFENVSPSFKRHFVSHGLFGVQVTMTQLETLASKNK